MALELTCQRLADLITDDEQLVKMVTAACRMEAETAQSTDPAQIDELRKRESQLSHQIQFLLANAGETDEDRRESAAQLKDLRRQRVEATTQVKLMETPHDVTVPEESQVKELLAELGRVLTEAATGERVEEIELAREIISILVGGRIDVFQAGERKAQRGWLQAKFRVHLLDSLVSEASGGRVECSDAGIEVVIDYKKDDRLDALAEKAKALEDQGLLQGNPEDVEGPPESCRQGLEPVVRDPLPQTA